MGEICLEKQRTYGVEDRAEMIFSRGVGLVVVGFVLERKSRGLDFASKNF